MGSNSRVILVGLNGEHFFSAQCKWRSDFFCFILTKIKLRLLVWLSLGAILTKNLELGALRTASSDVLSNIMKMA